MAMVNTKEPHVTRSLIIERALREDWITLLASLERKLDNALGTEGPLAGFSVEDTVGIYSSTGRLNIRARLSSNHQRFELRYQVVPFTVYPASLVSGECTAPRSYSEMNLAMSHVITKLLETHCGRTHTGWVLCTIQAEHVKANKKYDTTLVFERRS